MRRILLLISTVVLLAGCSTPPSIITVREVPSPELVADCPEPIPRLETNADLAWTIIEYRKALRLCNIDKKALRDWAGDQPTANGGANNGEQTIK
jgi:hypothetical protein